MFFRWLLAIMAIFLHFTFYGQEKQAFVMFYNVENLFDVRNDPETSDDEFLPDGDRHWNSFRMNLKLNNIAKVISNTGNWEPPAIIGFCEIENRYVLERLVAEKALQNWNYRVIHKDSPDERGIDVAAIYRPDQFTPLRYWYFPMTSESGEKNQSREILAITGVLANRDTIHLFFNHWPSRYSGLMETRDGRNKAASILKKEVEMLQKTYVYPHIIIMGDFNDQPFDQSLTRHLRASNEMGSNPDQLYNLSYQWVSQKRGTLKHQAEWNVFDQIFVSGSMLGTTRKLFVTQRDAEILEATFLFTQDEKYFGRKLFRTYEGYKYKGGFSDHLPVLLGVRIRE